MKVFIIVMANYIVRKIVKQDFVTTKQKIITNNDYTTTEKQNQNVVASPSITDDGFQCLFLPKRKCGVCGRCDGSEAVECEHVDFDQFSDANDRLPVG